MLRFKNKQIVIYYFGLIGLFFLLLNTGTIYSNYREKLSQFFLLLGGLCSIVLMFISNKLVLKHSLLLIITFCIIVLFDSLVTDVSKSALFFIIKMCVVFLILSILKNNSIDIKKILLKETKIFLIWGLLNYFISLTFIEALPVFHTFALPNGVIRKIYLGLFIENYSAIEIFGLTIPRLHGPFSEPGVTQFFYNLGFILCIFDKQNNDKSRGLWCLLFVISIFLCLSLSGLIIIFLTFLFYLSKKKDKTKVFFMLSLGFLICGLLVISKIGSISLIERSSDYLYILEQAIKYFPFGIGIGNKDSLPLWFNPYANSYVTPGLYSGLLTPMLYLGVFSVYYYALIYFSIRYFSLNDKIMNLAFGSYLLVTLFTQPYEFSIIVCVFISNGAINKNISDYEKKYCFEKDCNESPISLNDLIERKS